MAAFLKKYAGALTGVAVGGCGIGYYVLDNPEMTQPKFPVPAPAFTHDKPEALTRAYALQQMQQQYGSPETPMDMLVIGGGSTGTGVALDAATRGLKVSLIEREDYAAGASSKSTKLLHGGVRYLEKAVFQLDPAQLSLVFEALQERAIVLHQAPHLCQPVGTVLPCYTYFDIPLYWVGLKAYDVLAALGQGTLLNSSYLSASKAIEKFPLLGKKGLTGGVLYYDGQFNDARLCTSVGMTAARYGALVSNYASAVSIKPAEEKGTPAAVTIKDEQNPDAKPFTVYAHCVVNSTGPSGDNTRSKIDNGDSKDPEHFKVKRARGMHITLPGSYCPNPEGLLIPKTVDGRIVFVLPWEGVCIAGTTDVGMPKHFDEIANDQQPEKSELDFIRSSLEASLDVDKIEDKDIKSVWAGVRPLALPPGGDDGNSQNVVREHVISTDGNGILTIAGGKWTTYRRMAQDLVDAAFKEVPALASKQKKCVTGNIIVTGGDVKKGTRGFDDADTINMVAAQLNNSTNKANFEAPVEKVAEHLLKEYGTNATKLSTTAELAQQTTKILHPDYLLTEGEVRYLARNEQACRVGDVLSRRTRIAFQDAEAARTLAPKVADILASEHKWSNSRKKQELERGLEHIATYELKNLPGFVASA